MDLNQTSRYSKIEEDIIKDNFKGEGQGKIYEIRNVMLQLSDKPVKLNKEVQDVIYKLFIRELSPDVPLGMQSDFYFPFTEKLSQTLPEISIMEIEAKDKAIQYIKQQFSVLTDKNWVTTIKLNELKEDSGKSVNERIMDMMTYTFLCNYIDGCLMDLRSIANVETLSPEEQKKKAEMNSAK